jgi:hypothetical protein
MRKHRTIQAAMVIGGLAFANAAAAQGFSTSAVSPGKVPASGVISAAYPAGETATSYYFAADLKAGSLATQISYTGAPDSSKFIELNVLDASGRSVDSYYIKSFGANAEDARVFPINIAGKYTIKLNLEGPETAAFKAELGGTSLARKAAASTDTPFSKSFLAPSPLPDDGVIAGDIPAGDGVTTSYYFAMNLKAGELLSQIDMTAGGESSNMIELALLKADGREVDSYYTKSFEAHHDATRGFRIDKSGPYVLRVSVQGAETSSFKAEVGGSSVALSQ